MQARLRPLAQAMALACCLGVLPAQAQEQVYDPLEGWNRMVFGFNTKLDRFLIRPIARNYRKIVPSFARRRVNNFFSNLDDVNVVINDVLQGKIKQAGEDSGRLLINTTFGIGGLFDVAGYAGLHKNNEDFGQTFGVWGMGPGPYLVLPVLGPSNLRDGVGLVPDVLANPLYYVSHNRTRNSLVAMRIIDARVMLMNTESLATLDDYNFTRNAYMQRREYLVYDGEVYDEFDDY